MLQVFEFCGAFIGGHDFGFTETEGIFISTDLSPCNWDAISEDEKTRERAKFEKFKRSALFHCTT